MMFEQQEHLFQYIQIYINRDSWNQYIIDTLILSSLISGWRIWTILFLKLSWSFTKTEWQLYSNRLYQIVYIQHISIILIVRSGKWKILIAIWSGCNLTWNPFLRQQWKRTCCLDVLNNPRLRGKDIFVWSLYHWVDAN